MDRSTWRQRTGTSVTTKRPLALKMSSTSKAKRSTTSSSKRARAASAVKSLKPHWVSRISMPNIARTRTLKILPRLSRRMCWRTPMSEAASAREATATWAPASRAASSLASSSMGVARSASMKSTRSPRARSTPARTAAPLPWLCGRQRSARAGSVSMWASTREGVRSVLPSSTTMTSASRPSARRKAKVASRVAPRRPTSLWAGITMVSSPLERCSPGWMVGFPQTSPPRPPSPRGAASSSWQRGTGIGVRGPDSVEERLRAPPSSPPPSPATMCSGLATMLLRERGAGGEVCETSSRGAARTRCGGCARS